VSERLPYSGEAFRFDPFRIRGLPKSLGFAAASIRD
jgi:hypothetical protein